MRITSLSIAAAGLLLLSACATTPDTDVTQDPAPGDVTSPTELPEDANRLSAMRAASRALSMQLNADQDNIDVMLAEETQWSDSCLGLGGPAESCLAVITPGYSIVMEYQGTTYRYRTDIDGSVVRAEQ